MAGLGDLLKQTWAEVTETLPRLTQRQVSDRSALFARLVPGFEEAQRRGRRHTSKGGFPVISTGYLSTMFKRPSTGRTVHRPADAMVQVAALSIASLFEELVGLAPVEGNRRERIAATRARIDELLREANVSDPGRPLSGSPLKPFSPNRMTSQVAERVIGSEVGARNASFSIVGPIMSGKSTLLNVVALEAERRGAEVHLWDLEKISGVTSQVELISSFGRLFQADRAPANLFELEAVIEDWLKDRGPNVFALFDGANSILDADPDSELLHRLFRTWASRARTALWNDPWSKLSIVTATTYRPGPQHAAANASVAAAGITVRNEGFALQDVESCLLAWLMLQGEGAVTAPEQVILDQRPALEQLMVKANGHPHLLNHTCQVIAQRLVRGEGAPMEVSEIADAATWRGGRARLLVVKDQIVSESGPFESFTGRAVWDAP